ELGIQLPWQPQIVVVERRQEFAACLANASVSRATCTTAMRQAQQMDTGGKIPLQDVRGVVSRPVVNDDDFDFPIALTECAFDGLADHAGTIPRRDDNRQQGTSQHGRLRRFAGHDPGRGRDHFSSRANNTWRSLERYAAMASANAALGAPSMTSNEW